MPRVTAANSLGKEDRAIIYEGANKSQLCLLFGCDDATLMRKMRGLHPVGKRNGFPIWSVREIAQRMVKPTPEQVDEAIRRMNHADLPKHLTKEYWAGLRSRQEYEIKAGDLWSTLQVVERVSEMVKTLNMELNLLPDAVERQSELSTKQRDILFKLIDGAKSNMLRKLQEQFINRKPVEDGKDKAVHVYEEDDDEL